MKDVIFLIFISYAFYSYYYNETFTYLSFMMDSIFKVISPNKEYTPIFLKKYFFVIVDMIMFEELFLGFRTQTAENGILLLLRFFCLL